MPAIDYSIYELGQCQHFHHEGKRCIQPAYVRAVANDGTERRWCTKCHVRLHRVKKLGVPCPRCEKHRADAQERAGLCVMDEARKELTDG